MHSSTSSFECSKCGLTFPKMWILNKHMWEHTKRRPYKCDKCGRSYVKKAQLMYHLRVHNEAYKCEECGKTFFNKSFYLQHMMNHKSDKTYQCKICGLEYASLTSRSNHVLKIHGVEKGYKFKAFVRPSIDSIHDVDKTESYTWVMDGISSSEEKNVCELVKEENIQ